MVIQRIQTLYLLIAVILMAAFAFTTPLQFTGANLPLYNLGVMRGQAGGATTPDLLLSLLVGLSVVLGIVAIFTFRNLKLQMQLASLCTAFSLTTLVALVVLSMTITNADAQVHYDNTIYSVWLGLPVLAAVFFVLAYRGINHDKKLLSSSDRIR